MKLALYIINDVPVPSYARPQRHSGLIYPPSTATDLSGRPVGSQGYPSCLLSWDRISIEGWRWWSNWVGQNSQSTELTSLTLPDPTGGSNIYHQATVYAYHSTFNHAHLWKISRPPDSKIVALNQSLWIEGSIEVRITEIR